MNLGCDNPIHVNSWITCYLDMQLDCADVSITTDFGQDRIYGYSASGKKIGNLNLLEYFELAILYDFGSFGIRYQRFLLQLRIS